MTKVTCMKKYDSAMPIVKNSLSSYLGVYDDYKQQKQKND